MIRSSIIFFLLDFFDSIYNGEYETIEKNKIFIYISMYENLVYNTIIRVYYRQVTPDIVEFYTSFTN